MFGLNDNGIGVDPQYHDRIFEPFQPLRHRDTAGTGVGLAICKQMSNAMAGECGWNRRRGKVQRFSLRSRDCRLLTFRPAPQISKPASSLIRLRSNALRAGIQGALPTSADAT